MADDLDKIIEMIKNLDLQDDGIIMNHKIKSILTDFCSIVKDETMLCESMDYLNDKVLNNRDASLKFALLFSSKIFDALAMNDTKVRCKMLNLLQKNFAIADQLRKEDKMRLYNSITLLGEYYHRVRLADGSPIDILGQSLLDLLIQEILCESEDENMDLKLAKLILSQVTLNGNILRTSHNNELDRLLFFVRKNLIEKNNLESGVKALLLMTLDLYYSNFTSLSSTLEEMYTKYLVEEDKVNSECTDDDDKNSISRKKWSEQVSEDSFLNDEFNNDYCDNKIYNENENTDGNEYQSLPIVPNDRFDNQANNDQSPSRNNRKQWKNSIQPHFSKYNKNGNRYSASFDDDRGSVRSEGGSIKLYNVSDRMRHAQLENQDNWESQSTTGGGYQNYNGDRNSSSRNNRQYDNYRNNHRNNFDRPPRFRNSEAWRSNNKNYNGYPQEQRSDSKGPDSRSSSRNRTLPRPNRPNYSASHRSISPEAYHQKYNNRNNNRNNNYNNYDNSQNRPQHSRNFGRSNNRYSSNTSLASDTGTWERRGRRNSQDSRKHFNEFNNHNNQQNNWTDDKSPVKDEIAQKARNTAKYLNYLSEKN